MVGLSDEISEIGKTKPAVMNVLCISYLLSSPLVSLLKRAFPGSYEDALGKKFYGKKRCLETSTTHGQESAKVTEMEEF